jgi:hypothetical protein
VNTGVASTAIGPLDAKDYENSASSLETHEPEEEGEGVYSGYDGEPTIMTSCGEITLEEAREYYGDLE